MRAALYPLLLSLVLLCLPSCQKESTVFDLPENARTIDGIHYLTETKSSELICDNFTLTRTVINYTQDVFDPVTGAISQVNETDLPNTGGLRHPEKSYYLPDWKVDDYVEITQGELTSRVRNLPDKIRSRSVAPDRVYVWTAGKCLPDDRVLISLTSGGNCSNVCEAFAIIGFGPNGEIIETEALTYAEFKILNTGALDPRHRAYLGIPDHMDYKEGRWQYDLSCRLDPSAAPGQSLLEPALSRLAALPPDYKGEIEHSSPIENGYVAFQLNSFTADHAAGYPEYRAFPNYLNYDQITSDLSAFNQLTIKGYAEPCEFCPGAQLDEYIFQSEDCAEKWYDFALEMNTGTKAVGFIRKRGKTIIVNWPSAYYMLRHLPDIEKAIFGDIDPDAVYQKAEKYVSPVDRYLSIIPE